MIQLTLRLRAILLVLAWLCPIMAHGAPDILLERLLMTHRDHGDRGLRELARGAGVHLREEHGSPLVPVIVDRAVTRDPGFGRRLARASARLDATSRSWARLLVPAAQLGRLLDEFPQDRLRAPVPSIASSGMGTHVSESVALTGADGYQAGALTGAGVRVAVVDLGFAGLSAKIAAGELPQDTVAVDFTLDNNVETGTSHGVGVAEHVMDMAPGASLYCIKIGDQVDLQNAASYLVANNIRIANHSVGWFIASYYDNSGPINKVINDSHDRDGVFWSVASDNMAQNHWRGPWVDADGDNNLDFAPGDDLLQINGSAATVTIALNWNQYGQSHKTDLDLYVLDNNGAVVDSSTTTQTRYNDPAELVSFSYDSTRAPYNIQVTLKSGSTTGLDITLFSYSHSLEHAVPSSSQLDPADANGAFSVGAINQANWLGASPPIESYSSQGPTTDGRFKPELVAPDGTTSLTYGFQQSFGTSFAAPTVAGAAALLLEEDGSRTAVQLAGLLESGAIDAGAAGADTVYGYGRLQLPLIDSDNDGLTNVQELQLGTNPLAADTDQDGLSDYDEVQTWHTDPLLADTDGDGLSDFAEVVTWGTNPLVSNLADLAPRGNPDGQVNAGDLVVLARLVTGGDMPTGAEQVFGDLNRNGELDAGDMMLMERMVNGVIPVP
jgi:hypothetical protein